MEEGTTEERELLAVFNRLSVFEDEKLVEEALDHVEAITGDPRRAERVSVEAVSEVRQLMCLSEDALPLQRAGCAALANLAICGGEHCQRVIEAGGVAAVCTALTRHSGDPECVFRAFDALATLVSASNIVRQQLNAQGGLQLTLAAMKQHARNADIQFGGSCTLAGATMDCPANCTELRDAGGLQVLVGCYRNASSHLSRAQESGEDADDWGKTLQWALIALKNVVRCPGVVDEDTIARLDYGRYGTCLAMDELKWQLRQETRLAVVVERQRAAARETDAP